MIDVAIKTEKHFRIRIIKVGVNHFLLYHLHVLTIVPKSWTSLCELIHFISRLHLLHWVDTYGCGGWRSRMLWLKESNAVAEGDEFDGWRSRMQWPKETNAIAEGVECGGWRSRMRWPKESNAVAGGDTFWTLITRDCCIILNWVHLKKSRIIFFVIVTYWQSMARFRKNDFFKWAQKIKSVFCFIPHTHEGCDSTRISERSASCRSFNPHTHEGCDPHSSMILSMSFCFNPHTHEGCDKVLLPVQVVRRCFNPHTHEGCDF